MAATRTLYGSSRFASSSSSTLPRWSYDVFLSFRGEDTCKTFTDHLYAALVQARIHTFIDDDELPRGHDISSALLKSIEESRISIVVFSTNYASSRWCLDELVKIIECKNTLGQLVLPIFYDVDPFDVRNQTRCFGEAIGRHEKRYGDEMEKVEVRRAALSEAGKISGWDLKNVANGYETELIRKDVEEVVSCKLKETFLYVAKHPVGIESRVVDINSLLSIESDDVRMIGIYGLGGIGKTTIATTVYNCIFCQFKGSCFLANVREFVEQPNGLFQLLEQLLFQSLGTKNLKIDNVYRGINLMKESLHSKKVLIVLDDVDHLSQLNTLAGNHDLFGPGSRIIITTRDEHLLKGLKVDERYMAKEFNHKESLQLFSLHAFGETNPLENYADLANGIVSYAGGLPLALEVLGSYLFGRPLAEWNSAFDKLQQIPYEEIQKKLRISFDALNDEKLKDIFLDIACFFIGMDKDCAITILNTCDLCAEVGISVLIDRCLLKINERNMLTMHDLLRDMGREVIRQESPKELGKRSRLWFHKDVCDVLENNKGIEVVEGVILTELPMVKKIQWSDKAFTRMHNLRLLQINHVHLSGNFEHLLKELRWLCWHNYPLEYLPYNFHPEKLVILDMQFSKIRTLWKDGKHFKSLKILNISNSKCLTKSPIFCALSMLEELLLEGCTGLMELHESIGLLDKLVHLNLKDCTNLRYLPSSIYKLKSVKRLNLAGCAKLELPEQLGDLESLTELLADGIAIKQLPLSIGRLKNLRSLSLKRCHRLFRTVSCLSFILSWVFQRKNPDSIRFLPSSISGWCSLTELDLRVCNLSEEDFPVNFGNLSSLRALDLRGNNFCILPDAFSHLSKLEKLNLKNCRRLKFITGLLPNLLKVYAKFCASLEKISGLSKLKTLVMDFGKDLVVHTISNGNNDGTEEPHYFEGARICPLHSSNNLQQFEKIEVLPNGRYLFHRTLFVLGDYFDTRSFSDHNNFYGRDYYSHKSTGSSVEVSVGPMKYGHIVYFKVGVVYCRAGDEESCKVELDDYPYPYIVVTDKINRIDFTYTPIFFAFPASSRDYFWRRNVRVGEYFGYQFKGGQFEISIIISSPFEVKQCGVTPVTFG
ncbi:unnamed protein product [Camellia sinensis]